MVLSLFAEVLDAFVHDLFDNVKASLILLRSLFIAKLLFSCNRNLEQPDANFRNQGRDVALHCGEEVFVVESQHSVDHVQLQHLHHPDESVCHVRGRSFVKLVFPHGVRELVHHLVHVRIVKVEHFIIRLEFLLLVVLAFQEVISQDFYVLLEEVLELLERRESVLNCRTEIVVSFGQVLEALFSSVDVKQFVVSLTVSKLYRFFEEFDGFVNIFVNALASMQENAHPVVRNQITKLCRLKIELVTSLDALEVLLLVDVKLSQSS
mmetsp:Transcript_14884/g.17228  ORF Transcript_14884/g.17228 Transcript_14884/m.17228 type:complete len:265 (-) Transcript_14884:332-1126(-)